MRPLSWHWRVFPRDTGEPFLLLRPWSPSGFLVPLVLSPTKVSLCRVFSALKVTLCLVRLGLFSGCAGSEACAREFALQHPFFDA